MNNSIHTSSSCTTYFWKDRKEEKIIPGDIVVLKRRRDGYKYQVCTIFEEFGATKVLLDRIDMMDVRLSVEKVSDISLAPTAKQKARDKFLRTVACYGLTYDSSVNLFRSLDEDGLIKY